MKLIDNKLILLSATIGFLSMTHAQAQEEVVEEQNQELSVIETSDIDYDVPVVENDQPILDAEFQGSFDENGDIQIGEQISFGIEDVAETESEETTQPDVVENEVVETIEEPDQCPFLVHPDNVISDISAFEDLECNVPVKACEIEGFNLCPIDTVCTDLPISSVVSYRCDPVVDNEEEEEEVVGDEVVEQTDEPEEILEQENEIVESDEEIEVDEASQQPEVSVPVKSQSNNCALLKMLIFSNSDLNFLSKYFLFQNFKKSCS